MMAQMAALLAQLMAFLAALALPALATAQGPPPLGLAVIGAVLVAWIRWGPRPMPGLIPGLMSTTVLGINLCLFYMNIKQFIIK